MRWQRARVGDRPVSFGTAGEGPPLLFLHGWALGRHSYRRAIDALARRGWQVIVPGLPGFGGTPNLPGDQVSLDGYADWVARFLDAIDVAEPVAVVGHSFGGGVAAALAAHHPARVRSLVLANSIGGSVWKRGETITTLAERPLWDWGLCLPFEGWPPMQAVRILPGALDDTVRNLVRNPCTMWRAGQVARRADVRAELAMVRAHGIPTTILWSRRDGVIPRASFEELCAAAGVDGVIVDGAHAWLLTDPEGFAELATEALGAVSR